MEQNETNIMREYDIIKDFYGTRKAVRSGVLLINHIDEGLEILEKIEASDSAKRAYCLHPTLQSDEDFTMNKDRDFKGVSSEVLILVMEYRRVANSYLSKGNISEFVGFSCKDVKDMLVADKVQNQKDFIKYHHGIHPRSRELYEYFYNWSKLLGIRFSNFHFCDGIPLRVLDKQ